MFHVYLRKGMRAVAGVALAGLLLAGGAPALAETVHGKGLVLGKDMARKTIQLSHGRVLHVSESTVFSDALGSRSSLADLPVAQQVDPGLYLPSTGATIRFEARRSGGTLRAERIEIEDRQSE